MKILLTALLCMAMNAFARTPDYRITGWLNDENGQPAPYASVLLVKASDTSLVKTTLTDTLGHFEFTLSDTGRFMLVTQVMGYENYYGPVFALSGQEPVYSTGIIRLTPSPTSLSEVTITSTKKFIDLQAGKMVITPDNSPIASGSTAYEVLKRSPGVSIDQNQNLTLKGKTSVMVLIDDKPTYMTQDQLMNMLKNMPANEVATIEIINNPPARYDAAGNAGIINIRLKKAQRLGYNGSVYLGGGYGWYEKFQSGFNMNLRTARFNFFGSYNFNYRVKGNKNHIDRKVGNNEDTLVFSQYFLDKNTSRYHGYKAGIDYYISKKTTLGMMVRGTTSSGSGFTDNATTLSGVNNLGFDNLQAINTSQESFGNFTGNVNLAHQFDTNGRKLNIDIDYSAFHSDDDGRYETRYYNTAMAETASPQLLHSGNFSDVTIYAAKADYTHPLGKKSSFEAGLKSSHVSIGNAIAFEQADSTGQYRPDPGRTNDFEYTENINAAYISYNTTFKKGSLQVGLRSEQTANKGFSRTLDSTVTRQYISLFPSMSLSVDADSSNNFTLAYSRRIDRPSYQDLNPFLYYADPYTFIRGNPFLRPQFTDGISLTHGLMQFLFTTIGADFTRHYMSDILDQDNSTNATFLTKTNFSTFNNYYVSINTGAPIKKLFLMLNLTGYYNRFKTLYNTYPIDNERFTWNGYLSAAYSITHTCKLELSGFYNSPAVYGIFKMSPMYQVDAGLKKSFPRRGLDINLSFSDIFNTMQSKIYMNDNGLRVHFRNKWESRRMNLTLVWNFGKKDLGTRKRKTATEDEQNRVKSGGSGLGK